MSEKEWKHLFGVSYLPMRKISSGLLALEEYSSEPPFMRHDLVGWSLFICPTHFFFFTWLFYMIPQRPYLLTLWDTCIGVTSEQVRRFMDIA
jgi:hypothetical protein